MNCALCNNNVEDCYHVFFNFPIASHNFQDTLELVFYLMRQLNADDASLLACVMWSIWKQRNNLTWNNITDTHSFVFVHIVCCLTVWQVKCNIDVSSSIYNRVGIDICIRNKFSAYVLAKQH
jgi:hypothetical protein